MLDTEEFKSLLSAQQPLRVWSVVVTVFGDSIVPRGGEVWLGTLTEVLTGLGVDDQAVRAAVSRLTRDGWLERRRVGRNSYYRLKEGGHPEFAAASERIYGADPAPFNGRLALLIERQAGMGEMRGLSDAGWGAIGDKTWCRFADINEIAIDREAFLPVEGKLDVGDAADLVQRVWDLAPLREAYEQFLSDFSPFASVQVTSPYDAIVLRTLLIHAWRRIVLRDPMLPPDLLGPDWPGVRARGLAGALYRAVTPLAEEWLDAHATADQHSVKDGQGIQGNRFAASA